jgi:1-acyl-sn-glycerol-3-phosphate acyltransferase
MRTLFTIWAWIAIMGCSITCFFFQLVALPLTYPFDRQRRVVGRSYRWAAIISSKLNPWWRFRIKGPLPTALPERCVCVSNHRSHADPFLISYLPWEMKWLGKRVLFRIPFIGWSMHLAGDIPVRRGDRASASVSMARCADYLRQGMPIMIFPEGTRSKTNTLLPFKSGAFRLAIETGASILPMAVIGTHTAIKKHDWRLDRADAHVVVGEPISTDGLTNDDMHALRAKVRQAIIDLLIADGAPPDGD